MAPTDIRKRVVAEWLARYQGDRTQADYAQDITDATGWNIDRTRLGRYQNQRLPVGREVIEHLAAYAEARGYDAPDFEPEPAAQSFEERQLALLERQALAAEAQAEAAKAQTAMWGELVAELRRLRGVHEGLSDGLGEVLGALMGGAAGSPTPPGMHTESGTR